MIFSLKCLGGLLLFLLGMAGGLRASGLELGALSMDEHRRVCLDLHWEHAWHHDNGPGNHDAVWVFLKWRDASGKWLPLAVSQMGATTTAGSGLEVPEDQFGFFVLPPVGSEDAFIETHVCIPLADDLPLGAVEVRAFGIEMTWIAEGPFWLGDGSSNGSLGTPDQLPFWVENENEIPQSMLSDTGAYAPAANIPAAYPKGTKGFYCMKHEISQLQYVDFLNTLDFSQQFQRVSISPDSPPNTLALSNLAAQRNGIRIQNPGLSPYTPAVFGIDGGNGLFLEAADGLHRACNALSWADLCAYLDWAGLRPLTEMEFEKACRGPLYPVAGEFAWGTNQVMDANTLLEDGLPGEHVQEQGNDSVGLASHGYAGPQGPLRTGFAATPNSGRVAAGAGYFGVMEMSGNLWEQCVTVNTEGLQFVPVCGDGHLDDNGNALQATWPGPSGAGYRGGGWNSGIIPGFRDLGSSDRFYAGLAPSTRRLTSGGRGAR